VGVEIVNPVGAVTIVKSVLRLFTRTDRRKIFFLIIGQFITSLIDLLGVLLFGLFTSSGIKSLSNGGNVRIQFLNYNLSNYSQVQILIIFSLSILIIFILRSILSLYISYVSFNFLAKKNAHLSQKYAELFLAAPFLWIKKQRESEIAFAMTVGLQNLIIGVTGQFMILVSETFFIFIIFIMLVYVNPLTALVSFIFFLSFGLIGYKQIGSHIANLGEKTSENIINGNAQILQLFGLFREIYTNSLSRNFGEIYFKERLGSSITFSRFNWLQLLPKVTVEIAAVVGAFFIALSSYLTSGTNNLVTDISIFLAATARLAPCSLRLQQAAVSLNSFGAQSSSSLRILKELIEFKRDEEIIFDSKMESESFSIRFDKVSFDYEDGIRVLNEINFEVSEGQIVAVIGPSGSGKSTICNLIAGLLQPTVGTVKIGSKDAREKVTSSPALLTIVPQDPILISGNIHENVALFETQIDNNRMVKSLAESGCTDFVDALPDKELTKIGEQGISLSGGQKQKVAIARALYNDSRIILLDEPTSAQDHESEDLLLKVLEGLREKKTVIFVAHRLSTLRIADHILYIDGGKIRAHGSLGDIKNQIPEFEKVARMYGILEME
jgi:ABC-type multidrug transport system fused ATPase/permease subunit